MAVVVAMAFFASADAVRATTLKPITGDEQIEKAESIFRGRVVSIVPERDANVPNAPIFSVVQFTPVAVYKGNVSNPVSLRFLGGKLGDLQLKVDGMPQFEVGREYVLFVSGDSNRACPVVGWSGGSIRVDRESAFANGAVGVNADCTGWLRRTDMAKRHAVMPARLELPEFEALLRSRVASLRPSR